MQMDGTAGFGITTKKYSFHFNNLPARSSSLACASLAIKSLIDTRDKNPERLNLVEVFPLGENHFYTSLSEAPKFSPLDIMFMTHY